MDKIKGYVISIVEAYNKLPKEIKVPLYIAVSQGLSEIVVLLSSLEINSVILGIFINVAIVFIEESLKRRQAVKTE